MAVLYVWRAACGWCWSPARRSSSRPRRPRSARRPRTLVEALGAAEARARVVALVGEKTIEEAFAERHLIGELPASIWRQVHTFVEQLCRLPWDDRPAFCAKQSELMRRLVTLLALDTTATLRVMQAKLERP